eukprot:CAMPEP_0195071408 /NCGR_PEP_ID=MMETSP0448-20130528/15234_1 /TAXON_ID=66468 /ORGANISM="Heterocapsa triquestra, Strain CCMP 448" /LENGTH=54 /DNA_ID=CAMNT_0040103261 /DNA_START=321 /DNA_END=485 /DNA_ORIENTATION=+
MEQPVLLAASQRLLVEWLGRWAVEPLDDDDVVSPRLVPTDQEDGLEPTDQEDAD